MKGNSRPFGRSRLFAAFCFAGNGLKLALREPNIRIHAAAGLLVSAAGFFVGLTRVEWCILLLTIGGVGALEIVNTAIERTVDLVTDEYRPLAKMAKDLSAGAVLFFACIAVVIGCLLFIPKW